MKAKSEDAGRVEWVVYLLECADGSTYIGVSTDVWRRLREHNSGRASRYTRGRRPVKLLGVVQCESHSDALRHEHRLKALEATRRRRAFSPVAEMGMVPPENASN